MNCTSWITLFKKGVTFRLPEIHKELKTPYELLQIF